MLRDADILGVVSHSHEVHWGLNLDVVAERMLDGLPLRVFESIVRAGDPVPHHPCIQRPTRVNVLLAKVGVAVGILLDTLGRGASGLLFARPGLVTRKLHRNANEGQQQDHRLR